MNNHGFKEGLIVHVCDGPGCGANGTVDFVDEAGGRALIRTHGPGREELRWFRFQWLRNYDGSPIAGGAKLRR
jgi:hypothetical protein